jgi:hypothetical protein
MKRLSEDVETSEIHEYGRCPQLQNEVKRLWQKQIQESSLLFIGASGITVKSEELSLNTGKGKCKR